MQLGATLFSTKRTTKATKGIGQRDRKGATKDIFTVGSTQRIQQKLILMLVQT